MKLTLALVTLAALACVASGAGLRRVETEVSVAMQNKVNAFMMIYGDQLRHAPEYHKHPVEYLKKFINHTKGKIHSEIDDLEEDASKDCTDDATEKVSIMYESESWEQRELVGCTPDSVCGGRFKNLTNAGKRLSACVKRQGEKASAQLELFTKAESERSRTQNQLSAAQERRQEAHEKFAANLKHHDEADKVLSEIMKMLSSQKGEEEENSAEPETSFLEKNQKAALLRVSEVAPIVAFLEAPGDNDSSDRASRLLEICRKFQRILMDSTEALKEAEELAVKEFNDLVGEMEEQINEATRAAEKSGEALKKAKYSKSTCADEYVNKTHSFKTTAHFCVESHKLFMRQHRDNKHLVKLMHEVHQIVETKLTGALRTTLTDAVRKAHAEAPNAATAGGATGATGVAVHDKPTVGKPTGATGANAHSATGEKATGATGVAAHGATGH